MAQEREDEQTGSDIPGGDGTVSDEDVNAIDDGCGKSAPTGQDHSTEDRENQIPDSGVGAVQNANDTTSDVARIDD
jgi:hypothetical protein